MAGSAGRSKLLGARTGILLVAFASVFAVSAAPALADPGNGNGSPNPPGQANGAASGHATDGTAGTSGSPTMPQPLSPADGSGDGANTASGPYTSTRDGSPALNGNGDGLAVGKPCAGCVGKADNKDPRGQLPNGTDANAGYECDGNSGIGRTNPAHTGCDAPATPDAVVVDAVPVRHVSLSSDSAPSLPDRLPFTGSDTLVLVLAGLASLVVGGALLLLKRLRFRSA